MTVEIVRNVLERLLHSIHGGHYSEYKELTSEDLTCFEPETNGHPVNGLPFHRFFIENLKREGNYHIELSKPDIKVFGDTAYAAYTLIVNRIIEGQSVLKMAQETRIFHKYDSGWKMVHFHRS